MNACSMPNASSSTLAIGATQFVVQLAFEITWWVAGSYWSSLTPSTMVRSSPLAGSLITAFWAPASRCFAAGQGGRVPPLGGRADPPFRAPRLEVLGRLVAVREQPRRLDDDLGTELLPREAGRITFGQHLELVAVDRDAVGRRADFALVGTQHGVVLEQVREGRGVGDVVDRHEVEVCSALLRCSEEVAADPAESVDADLHGHRREPP